MLFSSAPDPARSLLLPSTRLPPLHTYGLSAFHASLPSSIRSVGSSEVDVRVPLLLPEQVLERFTRFIIDFIGQSEVAFGFSILHEQGQSHVGTLFAQLQEDSIGTEKKLELIEASDETQTAEVVLDFAIEISLKCPEFNSRRPNNFPQAPFLLIVSPSEVTTDLIFRLSYDSKLLPEPAVPHLLRAIAYYLQTHPVSKRSELTEIRKEHNNPGTELSILNFPPVTRPPHLSQNQSLDVDRCSNGSDASPALLHAEFERGVVKYPDRPALDFLQFSDGASTAISYEHRILSYAELDAATTRIAKRLILIGRERQQTASKVIPVFLTTSLELYVSYLAILKAGLAFCPLPVDAPAQRLRDILEDLQSNIVLSKGKKPTPLPWHTPESACESVSQDDILWLDIEELLASEDVPEDVISLNSNHIIPHETNLAYVMYTSGSTGKPKGVEISHLAASCSIMAHATTLPLSTSSTNPSRWFQFAAPTFDPSIMEIFVTLSSGGTLCSADRQITLSNIEETVTELRATVMMTTPSVASLLRPERLSTLKSLWTMGECLSAKVIAGFGTDPKSLNGSSNTPDEDGPRGLANAYGPTEGAINCTLYGNFPIHTRGSVIGPALSTCSLLIIDPSSHEPIPMAKGLSGELAIGGPQVALGYRNRPKQTQQAFVNSKAWGRLYRTGDKARIVWDEQNQEMIEFLGRITNDQVKLSGRRVELGEVEAVIASAKGVLQVAMVIHRPQDASQGSEQLIAVIVPDPEDLDEVNTESACKKIAEEQLLPYLRPWRYIFMSSLPRSPSGKLDRRAISKLIADKISNDPVMNGHKLTNGHSSSDQITPNPQDSTSIGLLDHIRSLLARTINQTLDQIAPSTNILSLGIDSLRAMKFLQTARSEGVVELTIGDVFRGSSAQGIASLVEERQKGRNENGERYVQSIESPIASRKAWQILLKDFGIRNSSRCYNHLGLVSQDIEKILPTTATQSGMLSSFLRSHSYINHNVYHLSSSVDYGHLQHCFNIILARHDCFRTVFVPIDDELSPFAQCILSPSCELVKKNLRYWRYISCNEANDTFSTAVQKALFKAEEEIDLERPTWSIALVKSSSQVAVVLSLFHAIFDGGSLQLLIEEVLAEYYHQQLPRRMQLNKAVDMHFAADLESSKKYWSEKLKEFSPEPFPCLTALRPKRSKGLVDTANVVSKMSFSNLLAKASSIRCSPLSALQASWAIILSTYSESGANEISFGSVLSGRLDDDSEICMGPTFTTVPVRVKISPEITNASLLQALTIENIESLPHVQIPLRSLMTNSGGLPYDTLLAFQLFGSGREHSETWDSIEYPPMANDFPVMVEVWPDVNDSLRLKATFKDSHLSEPVTRLMLKQLDDVLDHLLENPELSVTSGCSAVRQELQSIANPSPSSLIPSDNRYGFLHAQFEAFAQDRPNDVALLFKGDLQSEASPLNVQLTYNELNEMADLLASYLVKTFGPFTDTAVPICIERSPELYVALLAILKAGGGWCPIDTAAPPQRRHDLVVRTGSSVLLLAGSTSTQDPAAIPQNVVTVDVGKVLNNPSPLADAHLLEQITAVARPNHLAYLIWTSGTTGAPKGVQVEHQAAVNSMKALQDSIPPSSNGPPRCMQFSAYTFDVFVQDLFYTWGLGGTVISSPREIMIGSFAKLANTTKATHAHLTPSYGAVVPREACHTLEVITMIGEKLPDNVADNWAQNMQAFNTYGPAESTVVATLRQFHGTTDDIKPSNVGWPLSPVSCFSMKDGHVLMKNGVGELALGGYQVARGYLNDPEKSSARFVFSPELQQRVYLTGDTVRMLHDGSLEFIGRQDDLIKLAGIRVELSEISFALEKCHPFVDQVTTLHLSRPDRPTKVLVAFLASPRLYEENDSLLITSDEAVDISRAGLAAAEQSLPDYMIPQFFLVVKHIPRTPSAKEDRKALAAVYSTVDCSSWEQRVNPTSLQDDTSTWSKAEQLLLKLIHELTQTPQELIERTAGLQTLGIDSIRSIRLTAKLNEAGHHLSVSQVMRSRTIRHLASMMGEIESVTSNIHSSAESTLQKFDRQWHASVALKVNGAFTVLPCSSLQEGILSETARTPASYWSSHVFRLPKTVDIDRLRKAWVDVISTTQALRTAFIATAELVEDGTFEESRPAFLQLVFDGAQLPRTVEDVTPSEFSRRVKTRAEDIATLHHRSDIVRPPWEITLFNGSESFMMLTLHHSIHDGPSLQFILDDVQALYGGKEAKQRSQLTQALALTLPRDGDHKTKTERFWSQVLKDFVDPDASTWPDLTGKATTKKSREAFITHRIESTLSIHQLEMAAKQLGASSFGTIIKVAWGCILADYLESPAVVFTEVLSDRLQHPSLENTVAPLITTTPVPVQVRDTARGVIQELTRLSNEALDYRHVSPGFIRRILQKPASNPLYPAAFTLHPDHNDEQSAVEAIWSEYEDIVGLQVEHPLALNVYPSKNGLDLSISADNRLVNNAHLKIISLQIDALISAIVQLPDEPILELANQLPKSLLAISSSIPDDSTKAAFNQDPTYWVEYHAQNHPQWIAAEVASTITEDGAKSERWDFATLNSISNQVANFIDNAGIKRSVVAMCVGRTLDAYATIVGIFKSGNTYLPIEESLPPDRKNLLVEDSDTAILFTTRDLANTFGSIPKNTQLVCIDDPDYLDALQSLASENISRDWLQPSDSSYLLYTSGSTGKPKGVLVGRGNLSTFIEAYCGIIHENSPVTRKLAGLGKYLGLASRAFDVHVSEMFLAWRLGLTAVTGARSMLLDDLGLSIKQLGVTHASFVPSLLDQADLTPSDVPSLKFLSVGGEKLSEHTLSTWATDEDITLFNAYGPTEVTVGCTVRKIDPKGTTRNIGWVFADTTAYVLLPGTIIPAKRGQPGELCLTGSLVANGYHKIPNSGAFIENFHGCRMYRTGDIVRMMADDSIEYLGRGDDQAKIRGQRLELGEVSETIKAAAEYGVDTATLISRHPDLSRPQLISFVSNSANRPSSRNQEPRFNSDGAETALKLQEACRQLLPAYMVPDVIIPVSFIPLAPISGKADAKKLKALFASIPLSELLGQEHSNNTKGRVERELTETEEKIRDALVSTIKIDPCSVKHTSSIFQFGIDSLTAISLSIRLRKLGCSISVADVLSNPIIEQLALLVMQKTTDKTNAIALASAQKHLSDMQACLLPQVARTMGLSEASIEAVMPCLPLQEALVASSINNPGQALYVNHVLLKLSSEVDLDLFKNAWSTLTAFTSMLRTYFYQPDDDNLCQVILAPDASPGAWNESLSFDDDTTLNRLRAARQQIASEIVASIQRVPPVRLHLARAVSTDANSFLSISLHHSIYDGECFSMLMEELSRLYKKLEPAFQAPVIHLLEYLAAQDPQLARKFWETHLKNCKPTIIVKQSTNDREKAFTSERLLGAKLSSLERAASHIGATVPSVARAVFGVLLAKIAKQKDVIFGSVLSGRTLPIDDIESILAPCVTTVPQRIQIEDAMETFSDVVLNVHKSSIELLQHQHTPLRLIQRWVGHQQLFDILFSYIKANESATYESLWTEVESSMPADYPFAIEFETKTQTDKIVVRTAATSTFRNTVDVDSLLEQVDLLLEGFSRGETLSLKSMGLVNAEVDGSSTANTELLEEQNWTSEENTMREIVSSTCKVSLKDIGKSTSFYRLGIDSVIAIRFAKRLRDSGLPISSSDVIRYPCITALWARVKSRSLNQGQKPSRPLLADKNLLSQYSKDIPTLTTKDIITGIYHCTPLQSGMLTQTLASAGDLYVHSHVVELKANVDLDRLRDAWISTIQSNEILRTSFHCFNSASNSWFAAVHQFPYIKWCNQEVSSSVEDILPTIEKPAIESDFHIPPLEARTIVSPSGRYLIITMHHCLYDGVSLPYLFDDLARVYSNTDVAVRRPFSDAARVITQRQTQAAEFWQRYVVNYKPITIPCLSTDERTEEMFFATQSLHLNRNKVANACKQLNVTLQAIALLAYGKILTKVVSRRDIIFGHVVAGRSLRLEGAENIIGPLFNTVPFRLRLDQPLLSNSDAVAAVQSFLAESQIFHNVSLPNVQSAWRKANGGTSIPLFDSLFVYQKTESNIQSPSEDLWKPLDADNGAQQAEHTINLEVEEQPQSVILRASSRGEYLKQVSLIELLQGVDSAICDILDNPARSVLAFPETLRLLPTESMISTIEDSPATGRTDFTQVERRVRDILAEVAQVPPERIGLQTSIYSIGVDSIATIRVAALCRKAGIKANVSDILQGKNVEGICKRLLSNGSKRNVATKNSAELVSPEMRSKAYSILQISQEETEDVIPCLSGQLHHLESWMKSGRIFYEPTWVYATIEHLDVDRLRAAWGVLRRRHSILRTTFAATSTTNAVQVIMKPSSLDNNRTFTSRKVSIVKEGVLEALHQEARHPSDLFAPPVRLCFLQGDDGDAILLTLHHALYDAWTMPLIISDLSSLYRGEECKSNPHFTPFVKNVVRSVSIEAQQQYWKETLRQAQETIMMADLEVLANPTIKQAFVGRATVVKNVSALEATCRTAEVSLHTICLAAFARVLARATCTVGTTFGLYQAGRSQAWENLETLSGPCLNVSPLVVHDALTRTPHETAVSIREELAQRTTYEQSHLRDVLGWAGRTEGPLFDTFINLLWHHQRLSDQPGSIMQRMHLGVPTDFAASSPLLGRTAVDAIDTSYLPSHAMYVDVALNPVTDAIDFGIRWTQPNKSEDDIVGFINMVGEEIRHAVQELSC
ncbi:MAG: NRPS [Cirrosporium novae-zelandiae]|nr:MAG: NRPS [Cirrosporium novae-zelandiae]